MVVEWHILSLTGEQWVPWGSHVRCQMSGWSQGDRRQHAGKLKPRPTGGPQRKAVPEMTNDADAASVKPQHSQTCVVLAHLDLSPSASEP